MNAIRGKLDPESFYKLYAEAVRQVFGRDHAGRLRLRRGGGVQAADRPDRQDALPDKELQEKFKEAAQEIKTVDGLSELLN